MFKATKSILPLALACSLALPGSVHAAESATSPEMVGSVYNVSVAPDQTLAFESGIKTWIACLKQNDYKFGFAAWEAATGKTGYVFTTPSDTWASMDKDAADPAGKACAKSFADNVLAHTKSMEAAIYVDKPDMSKPPAASEQMPKYVVVDEYDLQMGKFDDFKTAATKYTEAAVKSKWGQYWWTSTLVFGGRHAADVVIVSPAESWAEIGKPASPKAKAMLEGVYGKDATKTLYGQFMDAVKHHTSNVYRYNKDLSYTPSK
ncbi:MAG TPA: hypothetical protein VFJ87_00545 [Rhodanobacteraceae bacterium]|jgi:hypothetical protein|nr:hypothetical protein [Rhodanobacteraceae bacterium]